MADEVELMMSESKQAAVLTTSLFPTGTATIREQRVEKEKETVPGFTVETTRRHIGQNS